MAATLLALLLALPVPFEGRVVAVYDGDTVSVLREGRSVRLRLHGIDAPELPQAFGHAAKQETSSLVFKREVHIVPVDVDQHSRIVAPVYLGSTNLDLELARRKHASRDVEHGVLVTWAAPRPSLAVGV